MPRERLGLLLKEATRDNDQEQIKKCNLISQKYREIEALREMEENKNHPKIHPLQFSWLESVCAPAKEPSLGNVQALPKTTITVFGCMRGATRASADSMVKKLEVEKESPWKAEKYKQLTEAYDQSTTLFMRSLQEDAAQQQQGLISLVLSHQNNDQEVDGLYQAGILQWRSARIQQFILEELESKQVDAGGEYLNDQDEIKQRYESAFQCAERARDYFLTFYEESKKSSSHKYGVRNIAFLLRVLSSIKLKEAETKKEETNRQSGQDDLYSSLESTLQDAIKAAEVALQQKDSADIRIFAKDSIYVYRLGVQSQLSAALYNQVKLEYNIKKLKKADFSLSDSEKELISSQGLLERNTLAISLFKQANHDLESTAGANFRTLFKQGMEISDAVTKVIKEKKISLENIKSSFPIEE